MDSLLDDLGSLGLHFEFRQGVDWGYGASLGKKWNGISSLLITTDAMERLKSHGVKAVSPRGNVVTLPLQSSWQRMYKMSFEACLTRYFTEPEVYLWKVRGQCGDSGFGFPHLDYHMGARTVNKFHQEIEEWLLSLRG